MTNRDQADEAIGAVEAILATWTGQMIPADELVGRSLNVIALTGVAISHALLDIADAVRETNRQEQE